MKLKYSETDVTPLNQSLISFGKNLVKEDHNGRPTQNKVIKSCNLNLPTPYAI